MSILPTIQKTVLLTCLQAKNRTITEVPVIDFAHGDAKEVSQRGVGNADAVVNAVTANSSSEPAGQQEGCRQCSDHGVLGE